VAYRRKYLPFGRGVASQATLMLVCPYWWRKGKIDILYKMKIKYKGKNSERMGEKREYPSWRFPDGIARDILCTAIGA
jgi:hypothetical protein